MKQLTGIVTSIKMNDTVVVKVTRQWEHPLYKKTVKRSKNFSTHAKGMGLKEGDEVTIQETRPISKTVNFKVVKKVN